MYAYAQYKMLKLNELNQPIPLTINNEMKNIPDYLCLYIAKLNLKGKTNYQQFTIICFTSIWTLYPFFLTK